jgi:hypothetical protein
VTFSGHQHAKRFIFPSLDRSYFSNFLYLASIIFKVRIKAELPAASFWLFSLHLCTEESLRGGEISPCPPEGNKKRGRDAQWESGGDDLLRFLSFDYDKASGDSAGGNQPDSGMSQNSYDAWLLSPFQSLENEPVAT